MDGRQERDMERDDLYTMIHKLLRKGLFDLSVIRARAAAAELAASN